MEVLRPTALAEALEARAAHPDALPIAGGTDVMVELNFDKARPPVILDLTRSPSCGEWIARTAPCGSAPASRTRG